MSTERVALYARISTREARQLQHTANQLRALRKFSKLHKWTVAGEYIDEESGTKPASQRPALKHLLADAAVRKFDIVLVWAVDRLTREGVQETFAYIARLKAAGVDFVSMTEEHFRTTGPAGELLIAIAAWIAQFERRRHVERVKRGLERARAEGKQLGRPRLVYTYGPEDLLALKLEHNWSLRELAAHTGITRASLARLLGHYATHKKG